MGVAEEYGTKLRSYQDVMHPAAYGDSSREWAHLVLTKASCMLISGQDKACQGRMHAAG